MAELIPTRKRGRPKRQEEAVAPTPQTLSKLKRDQVADLLKQGALNPDQERAARKIHSFSMALQRGMFPQSRLSPAAPPPTRKRPQASVERLTDAESEQWAQIYRPWAGVMTRKIIGRRPRLTSLGLVERIVNENTSPENLSAEFGLPRSTVIEELTRALDEYIAYKREKKSL
ncbi:MAG: hypothetical protein RIF37_00505 [Rhodospirillaceae bacterium]